MGGMVKSGLRIHLVVDWGCYDVGLRARVDAKLYALSINGNGSEIIE